MTSIVYEDDELQAFWLDGPSDFLLIAFGDLVSMANGESFSVEVPATKSGIACLGIMAKRPNWYPRENMRKLMFAVSALVNRYSERVLYGASMGGHGALKASHLMQASTTIALCPQWSINPADQTTTGLGWPEYYKPELMADMAIKKEDLSGAIFIISDPGETRDEFHRQQICLRSVNVQRVDAYFCDHNVTPVLSGTTNFVEIITLCRTKEASRLQAVVNRVRRPHFFRKKALIEKGLVRKRLLTMRVGLHAIATDPLVDEIMRNLPDDLKFSVASDTTVSQLPAFSAFLLNKETSVIEKLKRSLAIFDQNSINISLITPFGTDVYYEHHSQELLHSPSDLRTTGCTPVKLFLRDTRLEIFVEGRFAKLRLPQLKAGEAGNELDFEMREAPRGRVALVRNGRFLSADPSGTISCDRKEASQWEFFEVRVTAALR
ncbi:hypothetical protein LRX75_11405 [Rhizobium sp. DKSPLA3]|uniref:Uncharacterized protein n=1 Tax=Rhizobium quercicola TaxID=2901226 RepID=A0A9X1NR50_9HYPH|nr:hypothetical protein [Rhizobium quercicola]MCD7109652.1 hypothetical protein [Rhizobium quercicola]